MKNIETPEELIEVFRHLDRRGDYKEILRLKNMIWRSPRNYWGFSDYLSKNDLWDFWAPISRRLRYWEKTSEIVQD